ncbi:MAG: 3-phosphoshikimate 1-carboxyvinyltransferase [Desulfovibrionaceae bacterium]|nr:3-phosphoshikimate 1-carboxyvinyltransferase [Desulfovibrionaceae bacterium]
MDVQNEAVTINIPGSKSLSHRYLIGAGLAAGDSKLCHVQDSSDITVTKTLLTQLGVKISQVPDEDALIVSGLNGKVVGGSGTPLECNVGESGTSCRLLTAVFAAGQGLFRVFGSGRMHDRPVKDLCNALTKLGAGICYTEKSGCPPFLLQTSGFDPDLVKGELSVGMDASSQYFSGLLLASPMCSKPLVLELGGHKAVSWPYVGLTLQCLNDFGIEFMVETRASIDQPWQKLAPGMWRDVALATPGCLRITVSPGTYKPGNFQIEGDWSGASYFLAAGAMGKKPVKVCGLKEDSLQGDRIFLDILCKMGANVTVEGDAITVYPSDLHGVDLDMGGCPDLVQTVAVMAGFAHGSTRIHNVAHLRFKETDRIDAPAKELGKLGVIVDTLSDGLLISGQGGHVKPNKKSAFADDPGASLSAHNDHRMAMSLALIDVVKPGFNIRQKLDNPDCVVKSFPDFWKLWAEVTA